MLNIMCVCVEALTVVPLDLLELMYYANIMCACDMCYIMCVCVVALTVVPLDLLELMYYANIMCAYDMCVCCGLDCCAVRPA